MDAAQGSVLRTWDVGVAPFDVKIAATKAYVSNWGGRRPAKGDLTGPAGKGTTVRVDPVRHIASEGSLSIIDLTQDSGVKEIVLGQRTCALALSPNARYLATANSGSDTITVIDTRKDEIVETIWT